MSLTVSTLLEILASYRRPVAQTVPQSVVSTLLEILDTADVAVLSHTRNLKVSTLLDILVRPPPRGERRAEARSCFNPS